MKTFMLNVSNDVIVPESDLDRTVLTALIDQSTRRRESITLYEPTEDFLVVGPEWGTARLWMLQGAAWDGPWMDAEIVVYKNGSFEPFERIPVQFAVTENAAVRVKVAQHPFVPRGFDGTFDYLTFVDVPAEIEAAQ